MQPTDQYNNAIAAGAPAPGQPLYRYLAALENRIAALEQQKAAATMPVRTASAEAILAAVARCYGVEERLLTTRTRARQVKNARTAAMYLLNKCGASQRRLARMFHYHRTTILHAIRRTDNDLRTDDGARRCMAAAIAALGLDIALPEMIAGKYK